VGNATPPFAHVIVVYPMGWIMLAGRAAPVVDRIFDTE